MTDDLLKEAFTRDNPLAQLPALIMANIEDVAGWRHSTALATAHAHASVLHHDMPGALSAAVLPDPQPTPSGREERLDLDALLKSLGYQRVFDAIADAVWLNIPDSKARGIAINVSVAKFIVSLSRHPISSEDDNAGAADTARAGEGKAAWVLQRNDFPHAVFFAEAEARAELERKRQAEVEWREQNAHVADVRTYWNVYKADRGVSLSAAPTPTQEEG